MNSKIINIVLVSLLCGISVAQDTAAVKLLHDKDYTVAGIGMKMKLIPAGTFTMGSPTDEMCRRKDEVQHKVTISRPFYMGVYEVTQREFYKLMMPPDYDYEAWRFKRGPIHDGTAFCWRYPRGGGLINGSGATGGDLTDLNPMECVTWARAREFCKKLTDIERAAGRLPKGYVYRLPTEAEWEYACRAGTKTPYNVECDPGDLNSIRKFAHVASFSFTSFGTRKVGERKPNAWGLYDMHGNVYEWCLDWYGPYDKSVAKDPIGPVKGTEKVVRGGCFSGVHKGDKKRHNKKDLDEQVNPFLRSAARYSIPPAISSYAILGFRVVLGESK
ncbi:MAG: SUMF1/EgtB/PvdO family nonheme iron enzyme [Phycisphaerae bacterium]|jgi:formylglycine-generating enzyme required for sulfatase activity|nr:SUMF1/EgtB/PvdO family nonheme iron enzyme [Phycisphaerae bacterium]